MKILATTEIVNKKCMKINAKMNSTYDILYYHSFYIVITSPQYFNFTTIKVKIKYNKNPLHHCSCLETIQL